MNDGDLKPCPLGSGDYRISNQILCKGTIRIAVFDIDTDPSDEFKNELFEFVLNRLNTRTSNPKEEPSIPRAEARSKGRASARARVVKRKEERNE